MRARTWLAVICALAAIPASADGHAVLGSTGRTADGQFRLLFSAPIESAFARVAATGVTGTASRVDARRDPLDDHALLVDVPDRMAALEWRVLSRDGHVTSGVSAFPTAGLAVLVREPTGPGGDGPLMIVGDSLVLAGLLGLLGMLALRFVVVGPAWRSGGPRPPGSGDPAPWRSATDGPLRAAARGWWRVWWCLVPIGATGLVVTAIALLRTLDAGAADLGTLLTDTRWGTAWIVQMIGFAAAAAIAAELRTRREAAFAPDPPQGWGLGIGAALLAAAIAVSWSAHASSGTDASLGVGIDAVHLVASGLWLGGLVALVTMLPRARRDLGETDGLRLSAAIVVRFSGLAIACVGVLVVTGVYRALAELRSFSDFVDTGYGQALLVKLVIFAVLLVGGAYNRLVLHPRLERAALGLRSGDGGAGERLRVSVTAEIVVAAALIVVVAVLVSLPPP